MIGSNNKIFFFITCQKDYDSYIEVKSQTPGFTNFKREYSEIIKKNDKEYIISINCFDMNANNEIKKNKEEDKYKLKLDLNYSYFLNYTYEAEIFFEEKRTTFIYDYKIDESFTFLNLKLPFIEKFMLYKKYLNNKKSELGDPLSNAFIEDSIEFISDNEKIKRYNLEDFLELLLFSYKTNKIKTLLQKFNVKKCDLANKIDEEKYSAILEELELNPEIYTKYCFKTEEEKECKKQFYSILLCFKMKYGKYNVKSLINQKELKQYYAEIINENEKLYCVVDKADEELIDLIMNQKKLSFGIIKKIIFSFTPEKVIAFINKYYNKIYNEINDNLSDYENEDLSLSNVLNKENRSKSPIYEIIANSNIKKRKYNIILFSDRLYKNYFNNDEVKLFIINESIFVCLKNDKKYESFKNNELKKLVKVNENNKENKEEIIDKEDEESFQKNKELKKLEKKNNNNMQILEYIEKDFIFYEKSDYEMYYFDCYDKEYDFYHSPFIIRSRTFTKFFKYDKEIITTYKPLNIFKRFELETMDEEFFKKWNDIKEKFFKLNKGIIRYDLNPTILILNINDINDFEKVFNLSYIDDNEYIKNNFQIYLENVIRSLRNKFLYLVEEKGIINKNNIKLSVKLIYDIIKGLDKYGFMSVDFLEAIEKRVEKELKNTLIYNMYIYLSEYYFSQNNLKITQAIFEHMANYIISNNLINLIKFLKNIKDRILSNILTKIDSNIEEKMLYNEDNNIYYFTLLRNIRNEELVKNISDYEYQLKNIVIILRNIKNGELNYELINSIFNSYSKKQIFISKLSILLFNDNEKKKEYLDFIQKYLDRINYEFNYFKEFEDISYNYFYPIYSSNISLIETIKNNINKGKLNEIQKNSKKDIEKIHEQITNLHKKFIIKDSLLFINKYKEEKKSIFNAGKKSNYEIFNEAMNDFNELKKVFEENWESKIDENIIKHFYNLVKPENRKEELKSQLNILVKYHDIKTNVEMDKICDDIIIYNYIEKILSVMSQVSSEISNENSLPFTKFKDMLKKAKNKLTYKKRNIDIKNIIKDEEEKK